MRNSILILAATTCLAGASPALAQEAAPAPTTAPAKEFAGFRAEANIGYDQTGEDTLGNKLSGMRIGGAVGYDLAIGNRVTVGVEAGLGWTVAGKKSFGPYTIPSEVTGIPDRQVAYQASAAHDLDISARLGYAASARTLVYAKAGWTDAAYRYDITLPSKHTGYDSLEGVRLGVGLEQKLGKHVYAKAEYRYTMYGNDYGDQNSDRHQLLTGIGVRF